MHFSEFQLWSMCLFDSWSEVKTSNSKAFSDEKFVELIATTVKKWYKWSYIYVYMALGQTITKECWIWSQHVWRPHTIGGVSWERLYEKMWKWCRCDGLLNYSTLADNQIQWEISWINVVISKVSTLLSNGFYISIWKKDAMYVESCMYVRNSFV